jgi:DNA repair exonuclease SbcCD ATPase subunit
MATIDEIAKDLENLKKKLEEDVERLQDDIKSRKEEILNLEKALSEIVETKQLRVTDEAQIAGRNVIADGQVLDNHENRLNNHDSTLNSHAQTLSQLQSQINQVQTQLSTSINDINNREIFRYTVIPICHYDSSDTQGGKGGRQWTHPCGDSNLISNHGYSVEGPYFFGLQG